MAPPLARWGVQHTWAPNDPQYTPKTGVLWFLVSTALSTSAQSAKATAMAVRQDAMLDANDPVTYGTPFLDPDQRAQDRNGDVIP
jgi:hypothetical protein